MDETANNRDRSLDGQGSGKEEEWSEGGPHAWVIPVLAEDIGGIEGTRNMVES